MDRGRDKCEGCEVYLFRDKTCIKVTQMVAFEGVM